jgi:hypothetical protein
VEDPQGRSTRLLDDCIPRRDRRWLDHLIRSALIGRSGRCPAAVLLAVGDCVSGIR